MTVYVHEGEFVRVRVPAYLERSLQLTLEVVHAPFFSARDGQVFVVVLRHAEWLRLARRFASAEVDAGFRLVSVHPPATDAAFPARLARALTAQGIAAAVLPSFHTDHLLIRQDQVDRCLAVIRQALSE